MPRVIRLTARAPRTLAFGAALLESLGPDKPRKKITPAKVRTALDRAGAQLQEVLNNPSTAEPKHLVALYARLHEDVYGAFPEELREVKDFGGACTAARKLVADAFEGDPAKVIEFMRWVWQKQRADAKRKRANGEAPFRVGWRYKFAARTLFTDYRVAMQSRTR